MFQENSWFLRANVMVFNSWSFSAVHFLFSGLVFACRKTASARQFKGARPVEKIAF